MQRQSVETAFHFVGTRDGFERPLVEQSGVALTSYDEVDAGPFHGVNPLRIVSSGVKVLRGTRQAVGLLGRYRPQVILSTGGWVSLPVALAAWLRRVPLVVVLPDIEPGLTIKVLRLFARKVAVSVPESTAYFRPGQAVVTGYALRQSMLAAVDQREAGIAHFGLDPAAKTVLVIGGSRGSRAVNIGVIDALPGLLADDGVQVIHVTGTLDAERAAEQVAGLGDFPGSERYHALAYLHDDMPLAYAAADVVVGRSGAAVLAELPLYGLPSVLVPLAYSWRYQQMNADYLAERGAAVHLPEDTMGDRLLPTLRDILGDRARLESMQAAAKSLARPDGADNIARLLVELAAQA